MAPQRLPATIAAMAIPRRNLSQRLPWVALPPATLDLNAIAQLTSEVGIEVVIEVVGVFREQTPSLLTAFHAAATATDGDALDRLAHRLKGSALTLGLSAFAAITARAEHLAHSGDAAGAAALADDLDGAYATAIAALETAIQPGNGR